MNAKIIIESWDEESTESFADRAGEELVKKLKKYLEKNKINLFNDEVIVIAEILKK